MPCCSDFALGNVSRLKKSVGWGGRVRVCALGDCGGAKALLAGLREVDKIFVRPRLGISAVPLVPFLPICPRIQ